MVIVQTIMLIERLSVVSVKYDDCLFKHILFLKISKNCRQTRIHVGDTPIILCVYKVAIGYAGRQPGEVEITEWFKSSYRFHGLVFGIALITMIEYAIEWRRGEIWSMGIHVAQHHKPWLVGTIKSLKFRMEAIVQPLCFGEWSFFPRTPCVIFEVSIKSS